MTKERKREKEKEPSFFFVLIAQEKEKEPILFSSGRNISLSFLTPSDSLFFPSS